MTTRPVLPDVRPPVVRLERPLSIMTSEELGYATPGAFLVSAQKRRRAAAVVAPAGEFDGGRAFRELDDLRTRAEDVLHWVEESLAHGPTVAPEPPSASRWGVVLGWLRFFALTGLAACATLVLPDVLVLALAAAAYLLHVVLLARQPRLIPRLLLATLLCGAPVCAWMGWEMPASRFLVGFSAVALGYFHAGEKRRRDVALPTGPAEYVMREGEAGRYRTELCVAGDDGPLCVAIRCESLEGNLMRHILIPVAGATREDAATAARWAQDYDIDFRLRRDEEREAKLAAAEELRRVTALERSRRSLPEA